MRVLFLLVAGCITVYAQAQHHKSDSLLAILLRHGQMDTVRVNLLIKVADALHKELNLHDAMLMEQEALSLAEQLNYSAGAGRVNLSLGIRHYKAGEVDEAVTLLQHALSDYEKTDSKTGLALTYRWLGNSFSAISELNRAQENYVKAYTLYEEGGDKMGMAVMLANIGNIYYDQQQYEKAIEYHTQALVIKRMFGDQHSLATSYTNIGNNYAGLRQYDEAMRYYSDALAIFERDGDGRSIAYTLGSMGSVHEKRHQYADALIALGKAVSLLEQAGDARGLAEAYNCIGGIEMNLRLYKRSGNSLLKAQELAEQAGAPSELIMNYLALARLDSAMGNMKGAYTWMKHYTNLKEKVFNRDKSAQITHLQAAFDAERKDRTIQLLAKEKNYQENEKAAQRIMFALGMAVLLIILLGLLYFLRQRYKATQILKQEKAHSEELNRLKDKLFSIIAHDLRGPLNSLKALLGLASADEVTEAELKYLLGTIGQNTHYTTGLVDNLLLWARANLHGNSIVPQVFRVNDLVENNIRLLSPQADQKAIALRYDDIPQRVDAYADRNMIDLVLRNLLSNAIKFTPHAGTISVSVSERRGDLSISVSDTGMGMRQEHVAKLFGTENISTPGTENEKGTGLGLILCREFVEKNGGKISVSSREGVGSSFMFTVPVPVGKSQLVGEMR